MSKDYESALSESWKIYATAFEIIGEEPDEAFKWVFKRAFAIGKEKETVTQEEIEKAAIDYIRTNPFVNSRTATTARESFVDGANFALGKQEKDADTVIQGWVAVDDDVQLVYLYSSMPTRGINMWNGHGSLLMPLDANSFPDLTWESDPEPVEIIIKRKKR